MEWLEQLHSIWRWVILLVGLAAIVLAIMAAMGSRSWDSLAERLSFLFPISLDIQFLIGAILWVLQNRWSGDAFIGYIHPIAMIAAVALAHVGRSRSEKATGDQGRGRQAAIFFGASLVVILLAIPIASWPL
jgi:hypothetical protein